MCWLSYRDYCRPCWIVCCTTAMRYLTLLSGSIGSCGLLVGRKEDNSTRAVSRVSVLATV